MVVDSGHDGNLKSLYSALLYLKIPYLLASQGYMANKKLRYLNPSSFNRLIVEYRSIISQMIAR